MIDTRALQVVELVAIWGPATPTNTIDPSGLSDTIGTDEDENI